VLAARKLGLEDVPVVVLDHLSPTRRRALVIADNKLALNAGWDEELLALELTDLHDLGFDVGMLGFEAPDLSRLMGLDGQAGAQDEAVGQGIDYQEKYAVLVECEGEAHQQEVFERLTAAGYKCKVLVN
jgi:ParB-like chromosome segregation protein Spo0J